MCEKCEDKERMEEIFKATNNDSSPMNPEKYDTIKRLKKQLQDCVDEIIGIHDEMEKRLKQCVGKDIYKDSNEIRSLLKGIMDYTLIAESNAQTIYKTIEIIFGELYWMK